MGSSRPAGQPRRTTSCTVKGKDRRVAWGRTARRLASAAAESVAMTVPSNSTAPVAGASSPVRTRINVVLPAPLGPTMTVVAPAAIARSVGARTVRGP